MVSNDSITVQEAIGIYVSGFKARNQRAEAQQELHRFLRWCGADKAISAVSPSEIGDYGEQAIGRLGSVNGADRLQEVRKFLTFAKKQGLIQQNLAKHLRIRKSRSNARGAGSAGSEKARQITPEGQRSLIHELEKLTAERVPIATEIQRAAEDKDVRENAPLEAAREQLGHVESRIREIEYILKMSMVVDPSGETGGLVRLGSRVLLKDLKTNRQTKYTVVSASESRPLEGKISDVSPVGKALLNRAAGQKVEVETPRGGIRYQIMRVS